MRLHICHTTVYHYSQPVVFGPHRLLLRPIEEHERTIESSRLAISPAHRLRWRKDVYGNSAAIVDFLEPSDTLKVVSDVIVQQFEPNPFNFLLEPYAVNFPFEYGVEELPDLAPYRQVLYPYDQTALEEWLAPYRPVNGTLPTIDLLINLNQAIREFAYVRREEPGVQSPGETLRRRAGSCRDYATFLMEACRILGLASRFVSGYAHNPKNDHGSTHAWAEVYLPGAGWKGFDPTAGILACDLHIPVAVTRHPCDAAPISGTFSRPGECLSMEVTVQVQELP